MDGPQHQPYGLTSHLARADQTWPNWRENRRNAYPAAPSHSITGLEPGVEYKVKVRARYGANHPRGLGADRFSDQATQRIDDYRVDIDTTGALPIGEPQDAWVASGGDVDWFVLELRAAYNYDITVDGDEGLRAQLIGVYDEEGTAMHEGMDWSGATALAFARSGRHVFRVGGRHG